MAQSVFRHLEPFRRYSRVWQTDRYSHSKCRHFSSARALADTVEPELFRCSFHRLFLIWIICYDEIPRIRNVKRLTAYGGVMILFHKKLRKNVVTICSTEYSYETTHDCLDYVRLFCKIIFYSVKVYTCY